MVESNNTELNSEPVELNNTQPEETKEIQQEEV